MFKVKRLAYVVFFALSLQSSFNFGATTYPTDQFSIHKVCIKDPWNARNATPAYHADTYSWPCFYDYAIVHVPTLLAEQSNQIVNSTVAIKLQIDPIDFDIFYTNFLDGFEFAFACLFSLWIISAVVKHILKLFNFEMKFK